MVSAWCRFSKMFLSDGCMSGKHCHVESLAEAAHALKYNAGVLS